MTVYRPTYRDPVVEVPLGRRRSPWNYRVTFEADKNSEEFYQGQSGTNAKIVYSACIWTAQSLRGTATVRMADLDGREEIGSWATRLAEGQIVVNHEIYGDPMKERPRS